MSIAPWQAAEGRSGLCAGPAGAGRPQIPLVESRDFKGSPLMGSSDCLVGQALRGVLRLFRRLPPFKAGASRACLARLWRIGGTVRGKMLLHHADASDISCFQAVRLRNMTLSMTSSRRMQATSAAFQGFPALVDRLEDRCRAVATRRGTQMSFHSSLCRRYPRQTAFYRWNSACSTARNSGQS